MPDDTTDLRTGPALSERLLALLPLVGVWNGTGRLVDLATGESASIGLQLAFAHDGREFLAYESRAWIQTPEDREHESGTEAAPSLRESGYWRRGFNQDAVEVTLADSAGAIIALTGIAGDARWELATDSAATTPTGRPVRPERRLYAVVRDALMVVAEQKVDEAWMPHLNAQLFRAR